MCLRKRYKHRSRDHRALSKSNFICQKACEVDFVIQLRIALPVNWPITKILGDSPNADRLFYDITVNSDDMMFAELVSATLGFIMCRCMTFIMRALAGHWRGKAAADE